MSLGTSALSGSAQTSRSAEKLSTFLVAFGSSTAV
jgi:hypothetical protein